MRLKSILFIFIFSITSYSDDSYLGSVGGNAFPMGRADSIQMIKENIYIQLFQNDSHVKCQFWFYNSGSNDVVSVGFPNFHINPGTSSNPIRNFTCRVNGETVTDIGETKLQTSYRYDSTEEEENWYTWIVEFKSKDTVFIENEYDGDWSGTMCEQAFVYTIGTGSSWAGPIKEGRIVFDHSNLATTNFVIKKSIWAQLKPEFFNDSTVYSFSNYLPKRNEEVDIWFHSYWSFSEETDTHPCPEFYGTIESIEQVRLMKNELFARHGYVFKDTSLSNYFAKQTWYKPNNEFEPNMLPNGEKQYVKNLLGIKEKLMNR
ncbi:MAG: YARHG domain-containing protein [Ignavibacteriae bacterium]|nr:YARHG domain-containing protein [Ignavibacteriota bacterium]